MDKVKVYNYADDNTAPYAYKKAETMKTTRSHMHYDWLVR